MARRSHHPEWRRASRRGTGEVRISIVMFALTATAGAVDAVTFLGLGRAFAALATGNVLLASFGVAKAPGISIARPAEALAAFVGGVAAAHAIVLLAGAMGWRSRTMVEAAIPDMPTTAVQVSLVKALVDVLSFRRVLPAGRRWRGRVGPRPSSACSPVA